MHFVYILLLTSNVLYTGCTNNLQRRLSEHESGQVFSTKNRFKELLHYEAYAEKSDAVRREKYLKSSEGKKTLRKQIRDLLIKKQIIQ